VRRERDVFERVVDFGALLEAARRAARGKRQRPDAAAFRLDLEPELLELRRALLDGTWRPGPFRSFRIVDPKPRLISAAPFRDRVVHHALCAALEPRLERHAIADSFACRPGKGTRAAVLRAQAHARKNPHYLKLDVRHFFETADHAVLKARLRRLFEERRLLALLDVIIDAGAPGSPPGKGLPIGNLTSQHFANLYLGALDHHAKARLRVPGYARYMDDILVFGPDPATLAAWRAELEALLAGPLRLEVKTEATRSGPVSLGVPFLGFRVFPRLIRLDHARARRLGRRLSALERRRRAGDEPGARRSAESLLGWAAQASARRFVANVVARLEAME
jgi:RNA-directed DNA polymerase